MQQIFDTLATYPEALPLSWSRVNTLLTCPRKFDLQYRKRQAGSLQEHPDIVVGKLVHRALELAVNRCKQFGFLLDGAAFKSIWTRLIEGNSNLPPQALNKLARLYQPTGEILERIITLVARTGASACAERRYCFSRNGRPVRKSRWQGIGWVGFVDLELLCREKGIIVDYKSDQQIGYIEESNQLQTAMYAYALLRSNDAIHQVQTYRAYLIDAKICPVLSAYRKDIDKLENELMGLYEQYTRRIVDGEDTPISSASCHWCEYAQNCPTSERYNDCPEEIKEKKI